MKIIDLTHPVRLGTAGFPTCAKITGWAMRESWWSNYNVLHVSTDLHTGTHLDAMRHCVDDGLDVARLPLEHCIGTAVVVDAMPKGKKGAVFEVSDFQSHEHLIREHGKILLRTGWSEKWETPEYNDEFPGFSREAATYLVDLGIHLIGMEQPSVHATDHLEIHRIFFRRNVIVVEGLAALTLLPDGTVEFSAAPWRFEEADGSPIRAYCRV